MGRVNNPSGAREARGSGGGRKRETNRRIVNDRIYRGNEKNRPIERVYRRRPRRERIIKD